MLRNNFSEGVIPVIFIAVWAIMFIGIASFIVISIVRNVRKNAENARMPQETLHARVVAKRTNVWGDHATTSYYVTFELDTRERAELKLSGAQYGMLAEGDDGMLTYQGDRFLEFQRNYI